MLFVFDDNDAITFPKVVKDWLIFLSYWRWSEPMVSVLFIFYEPAKSHKFSLAFLFIFENYFKHSFTVRVNRFQ